MVSVPYLSCKRGRFNGTDLINCFKQSTQLLQNNEHLLNKLNVFPVPDGDTGTNMLLTLRAALNNALLENTSSSSQISAAFSQGALLGAKGNSGVILSQFFQGLSEGLKNEDDFDIQQLANGFTLAEKYCYQAVADPKEGTLLTVIREVAAAARNAANENKNIPETLAILSKVAKEVVEKTPLLLSVLSDSGVVDSGSYGLFLILEGMQYPYTKMLNFLKLKTTPNLSLIKNQENRDAVNGFCINFLLQGKNLNNTEIKKGLEALGASLVISGDNEQLRIHIHAVESESIFAYAKTWGELVAIQIEDMDKQVQNQKNSILHGLQSIPQTGLIAIGEGKGIIDIFINQGVSQLLQAENKIFHSKKDILSALNDNPCKEIIILPNHPSLIPIAEQASQLSTKIVKILPTKTLQQGIAASLAYNPEENLLTNFQAMLKALQFTKSAAIKKTESNLSFNGLTIKQGQFIGLLENELVTYSDSIEEVILQLFKKAEVKEDQLVTFYTGNAVDTVSDKLLSKLIATLFPETELEFVWGGHPVYDYLIAIAS